MQRVLTTYARDFNRKYKKVGQVFQGRCGAKVVDREAYLLELIRYIPLQATGSKTWAGFHPPGYFTA